MTASNNLSNTSFKFEVLLDIGSHSNSFSYLDGNNLGVEVGDIVSVKLKGRLLNGLTIARNPFLKRDKNGKDFDEESRFRYLSIEGIVQKKVIQDWWREWLETLALSYRVSNLKMFKTAFPPGWIGKHKKISQKYRYQIWIKLQPNFHFRNYELNKRELSLINFLGLKGKWQSELIKFGFNSKLINLMISKKLLIKTKRKKIFNTKLSSFKNDCISIKKPNLTQEQKKVYVEMQEMQPGEVCLLWGETGSGKTEVYMRMAEDQLLNKKSCLILAPEIGLIPQLIDRFSKRFQSEVIEYHSNCSSRHRTLVWEKIIDEDEPVIVVGTRSAVFLPIRNLGLIVMDEEHDVSYKQDSPMPCYDARDVALERVKRNPTKLIFGSATPSMRTWKRVVYEKKIRLIRMKERISTTEIPEIKVVDMRSEFKKGNTKIFCSELLELISKLKENQEQAIILIPRRGYNGFLSCRNCGFIINCPNCDVPLSVHMGSKGKQWLSCHWCDHKAKLIYSCPDCKSNAFKPFGIGTQRVIEFLNNEFPELRVLRFDRDTTSGKDGHRNILSMFSNGNADILVGTQMLAKGIDIPNVTLSVVIAADGLLHRPDISSEEKSLQLFLQLAGRAGRADKTGKVVFQTYKPSHPVLCYLKNRNYEGFLAESSILRKDAKLFPFCNVCLFKVSGKNYECTENTAAELAKYLMSFCQGDKWTVIGPAPSLIAKVGNKFRWQILMHGPENSEVPLPDRAKLWQLIPKNVFLSLDLNPVEL
ncbi:primosomal protein N' (replication factor Y) [Prochlorococcus marinus str. MIT 9515]|uniref:Replication restart protein PriA n=2 Tax=Prochlorococcus marinus TaxID=1219 RepID=A2BVF9_PROM5|nr:primosomal protein N' [Prochlorococcus marinus]ABM71770.1 primosomal protein N' (replication factor Y) [Prochlorococcus marinus str. MIT 9515]